jgi:hypothetical protein
LVGKRACLLLVFAMALTAAKCVTAPDDRIVSVNVESLGNTYLVSPGATAFTNPNDCTVLSPASYLKDLSAQITAVRVVDIQLQTLGAFGGSVVFGTVSVNAIQLLSYNGPWSNFSTRRSLLQDGELQVHDAGISELRNSVQARAPITLCAGGSFSQQASAGLSLRVDVRAQVDLRRQP